MEMSEAKGVTILAAFCGFLFLCYLGLDYLPAVREHLAALQQGTVLTLVGAGGGLASGVYLFLQGFRVLRNQRLVANLPTSKCRSVAMGLVEVTGRAVGEKTLLSPFVKIPSYCSYTEAGYWVKGTTNRDRVWADMVGPARAQMAVEFFYVEDQTGRVKVDPTDANLRVRVDLEFDAQDGRVTWHKCNVAGPDAASRSASIKEKIRVLCAPGGRLHKGSKLEFKQQNLCPGDPVYVLGEAGEVPGVADEQERIVIRKGSRHPWFYIAEASQKEALHELGQGAWLRVYGGAALSLASLAWLVFRFF